MPEPIELTDEQTQLLLAAVDRHEQTSLSHHVGAALEAGDEGEPAVENSTHHDARVLIRAGLAEWHPPLRPIPRVIARQAGRAPVLRILVDSQAHIVPTPKGRDHAAGIRQSQQ